MQKIKISELPEGNSLVGLYTIGTDANNESVKVSLEFLEDAAEAANTAAEAANEAAQEAKDAAASVGGVQTNKIVLVNGDYTATIELDENGYVHVDKGLYSDVALSVGGSDS